MKFTSSFTLSLSLLTLWGLNLSCNPKPTHSTELISIETGKLEGLIRESAKPYVLVNVFATWCKPCRAEIPELVAVHNSPESQVDVLFVSVDDPDLITQEKLADFLKGMTVNFRSYHMDPTEAITFVGKYHPGWNEQIPLNLVFTKEGRMVHATGMTDRHEIEMVVHKDLFLR